MKFVKVSSGEFINMGIIEKVVIADVKSEDTTAEFQFTSGRIRTCQVDGVELHQCLLS